MRTLTVLALLFAAAPPACAQSALTMHSLCTDCAPPPSASDAPPGFAPEDWSFRYASGRSHLSTLIPLTLSAGLARIHRARRPNRSSLDEPLAITALSLAGAGLIIGPSVGEWCLGRACARRSLVPIGVRLAGVAGIVWAVERTRRQADDAGLAGLSLILQAPLRAAPGLLVLGAGMTWSFRNAPRVRCGSASDAPTLSVAPATPVDGSGSGLALRLTL